MESPDHPAPTHWCHQCSVETAAVPHLRGSQLELMCRTCGGGFIESLEFARDSDLQSFLRRHERLRQRAVALLRSNIPEFREVLMESVRVMDLLSSDLRAAGLYGRSDAETQAPSSNVRLEEQDSHTLLRGSAFGTHDWDARVINAGHNDAHGIPREAAVSSTGLDERMQVLTLQQANAGLNDSDLTQSIYAPGALPEHTRNRFGSRALLELTRRMRAAGVVLEHRGTEGDAEDELNSEDSVDENGDEDEEESDFDEDLSGWDSLEEDDAHGWEEVDDAEINLGEVPQSVEQGTEEGATLLESNRQDARSSRTSRLCYKIFLHLIQSPHSFVFDTYVGDPGDYVDEQGFEEILQQLIDSDNTCRGGPPAANSVVKGLPTVLIQQKDVDDGSALCAICEDEVALSEPAKQLPCLHVYHSDCILPWLGVRNSCPVCRYELPTDDPDYEEQKRSEKIRRGRGQEPGVVNNGSTLSGDIGGEFVQIEGPVNEGPVETERIDDLRRNSSKGEVGNEGELRGSPMVDNERDGSARTGISVRNVISSPLFSVVGVLVVSCVGNFLLGWSSSRSAKSIQAGRVRQCTCSRSWWGNLFG